MCGCDRFHLTMNANVHTHMDKQDNKDSLICWANDRDNLDGAFHIYDLALCVVPKGFTLMHLDTENLLHGSVAPSVAGCYLGAPRGVLRAPEAPCVHRVPLRVGAVSLPSNNRTNSQPSSLVTRLKTFKEVTQHLHRAYALKQHHNEQCRAA